jgi:8-amino-7-oxononanoate synthase
VRAAHDAWLLLDDAHGIGVLGEGHGALQHFALRSPRVIYMATLGKALGGYGAFVGGAPEVVDWLLQRARTYVYSTALPASAAATAIAAMDAVEAIPRGCNGCMRTSACFAKRARPRGST